MDNKIYYIENSINEYRREIMGYFSSIDGAKNALKDCCDFYRSKGTGKIYSIELNVLNAKAKLEYEV